MKREGPAEPRFSCRAHATHNSTFADSLPKTASWFNQTELWIAEIDFDLLGRVFFKSAAGLARTLRRSLGNPVTSQTDRLELFSPTRRIGSTYGERPSRKPSDGDWLLNAVSRPKTLSSPERLFISTRQGGQRDGAH
jgi:hypothetical protein